MGQYNLLYPPSNAPEKMVGLSQQLDVYAFEVCVCVNLPSAHGFSSPPTTSYHAMRGVMDKPFQVFPILPVPLPHRYHPSRHDCCGHPLQGASLLKS